MPSAPSLGGDCDARRELTQHLDDLRRALGAALGRPLVCAEQYISIHRRGATLKRHMDEKHDELKGARGWTTSHRRSVSWLLYLTDECEGGELRSYCRNVAADAGPVGAHDGNIQVGWLGEPAVPVFMDSWCGAEAMATEELTEVQEMLEAAKAMGHRFDAEAAPQPAAGALCPRCIALSRASEYGCRPRLTSTRCAIELRRERRRPPPSCRRSCRVGSRRSRPCTMGRRRGP